MFDKFFEQYPRHEVVRKPNGGTSDAFGGKLPSQLIEFWNAYGFGTYMDGFLKVVDPAEFQEVFDQAYNNQDDEIVIGVTAFGDFLTWTGDAVRAVYFKDGCDSIIESGEDFEWFFDMDLTDPGFLRDNLNNDDYPATKAKLGELGYRQCYGYVPLLGLGGTANVENLQTVDIEEHVSLIAQAVGRIA